MTPGNVPIVTAAKLRTTFVLATGVLLTVLLSILPARASSAPTPTITPTPTPTPTPATYAGLVLHCRVTNPVTIRAGATYHDICNAQGKLPNAAQYGVVARAVVYVQGGATDTTCLVELSDGAVYGTPVTVPANTTVSIPFEDTGPGYPGQQQIVAITVQAGEGGPVTVLPGTTITLEAIASQPGNNSY
jgi:hypothetical protein